MECKICGSNHSNLRSVLRHVKNIHEFSEEDYVDKFGLRLFCNKCGGKLPAFSRKTKGICKKCYCSDMYGSKNPFYGKKHGKETIEKAKIKCIVSAKKLWQNKKYRDKVIKNVSKPRRNEFKKEQSERVKQWYKNNPEQRNIRSDCMKKAWADGKIKFKIASINESKLEIKMREMVRIALPDADVRKKTLKIGKKWYYPDVVVGEKHIIEFYGTLWHSDPKYYDSNKVVHHKLTAQQIWDKDKKRVGELIKAGYNVMVVWQREFVGKEQETIERIKEFIKNGEQNVKD